MRTPRTLTNLVLDVLLRMSELERRLAFTSIFRRRVPQRKNNIFASFHPCRCSILSKLTMIEFDEKYHCRRFDSSNKYISLLVGRDPLGPPTKVMQFAGSVYIFS